MESLVHNNLLQTNIVALDNIKLQKAVIVDQLHRWNIVRPFTTIVLVFMLGLMMMELDCIIALQTKPNSLLHSIVRHD